MAGGELTAMTVSEFADFIERNLEQFVDTWTSNQKRDPEDWPEKLGLSDWLEQVGILMRD